MNTRGWFKEISRIAMRILPMMAFGLALSACGGAVQDHFSQHAPGTPAIDVVQDPKNAWIISWPNTKGAQQYAVYWADNEAMNDAKRVVIPASEKQIDASKIVNGQAKPGSTVYIVITAVWEGKESGRSNVITYKVQPTTPADVATHSLAAKSEITWATPAGGATGVTYNVYWSTRADISTTNYDGVVKGIQNNSFVHDLTGFTDQTAIYYLVAGVQDGVESPATLIVTTVVKDSSVPIPKNVAAVVNGSQITVSWVAVTGADSYRVYRSTHGDFDSATVMSFTAATAFYEDKDLQPGTDYYYWVAAFIKDSGSALSIRTGPVRIAGTTSGGGGTVNQPPAFTIASEFSVDENVVNVVNLTANDVDSNQLTYSITQNSNNLFAIVDGTNQLVFKEAPDYESAASQAANNRYSLTVAVSDEVNTVTKNITVVVKNVDEKVVINMSTNYSVDENKTFVADLLATDPEGAAVTFGLAGQDTALFKIVNNSQLVFITEPDFESPNGTGGTNNYALTLSAKDATNETKQQITVTVKDVNEPPFANTPSNLVITQGNTAVTKLDAGDPEGKPLQFTLSGGDDKLLFTVDAVSGQLSFLSPPFVADPKDANLDNIYNVKVKISDGVNFVEPTYNVTVDLTPNEPPSFTLATASFDVPENTRLVTTLTATDPNANDTLTYSVGVPLNGNLFAVENQNQLVYKVAPNYETEASHSYQVIVYVSDGRFSIGKQLTINTTNVNEAPTFTTLNTTPTIAENALVSTVITSVSATDPEGDAVSFYISGTGTDDGFFNITTGGNVTLKVAKDFENPLDADHNNIYNVTVRATDGANDNFQTIAVSVTNVNESPVISAITPINFNENGTAALVTVSATDPEKDPLTYSLVNTADAQYFNFNPTTHVLTFKAPPDYENPLDSGADNQYDLVVQVTDGTFSPQQNITVRVQNLNDTAPVFDTPVNLSINENLTLVTTINYHDDDGALNTMSLNLLGGADQSRFTFNTTTRELRFVAAPDFEAPTDANSNNVYEVSLRLNDGVRSVDRTFMVQVNNVLSSLAAPSLVAVPMTGKAWLKWPAVSGSTNYVLYYSTQSGITPENYRTKVGGTRVTSIGSSPYMLNGLANGTTYYFVVTATDGSEEGLNSNERNAMPFIASMPLNDTGALTCATATAAGLACNNSVAGTNVFSPQDAERGRDSVVGLPKTGTGEAGFDYTKLDAAGNVTTGTPVCLKDNVTGLIWEIKTTTGLRNYTNTYTWYNTDNTKNGGTAGTSNGGTCGGTSSCDTQGYIAAVNAGAGLCGGTNWRLPTPMELESIVNYHENRVGNTIDALFPNTTITANTNMNYWTSQTTLNSTLGSSYAWMINFKNGVRTMQAKNVGSYVRLVRRP